MISILAWILFGALADWIASIIMRTNAEQGALTNIVVGILGAVIGGFVVGIFGGKGVTDFSVWSLLVAILGAVILLSVMRAIRGAGARTYHS